MHYLQQHWKQLVLILLGVLLVAAIAVAVIGFFVTPVQKSVELPAAPAGTPFYSGDASGSNYYRIPSVITLRDGTLVAAADARFGGTHDSPNNLDTAVSSSKDGGKTWSPTVLANHFVDYEDAADILKNQMVTNRQSASSIDPSLLEDTTINANGRLFLLTDMFPGGYGSPQAKADSGYVEIDGKRYLKLKKQGDSGYDYTVRENGAVFDAKGQPTAYTVNSRLELLEGGKPLTVRQKQVVYWYNIAIGRTTAKEVPMHIMYKDALFQPAGTSYLVLQYSDDQGATWSDPVILNAMVKTDDMRFLGVGPGQGIQLQIGANKGRLLFPVYTVMEGSNRQACRMIYSDDHGVTWGLTEGPTFGEDVGMMSEAQAVELPNGMLQLFARTTRGYAATSVSRDGGLTWSEGSLISEIPNTDGSGCQLSAIRYNGLIEGEPAVLVASPAGKGRTHGVIHIGLLEEAGAGAEMPYNIDWKYSYHVTDAEEDFAYSCLTQLADGRIGILYEANMQWQAIHPMRFETFSIDVLTGKTILD